ncbi:hypothetical protein F5888DRAFT_1694075, partial [Russula emetica]
MASQSSPRSSWERLKCLCSNWALRPLPVRLKFTFKLPHFSNTTPLHFFFHIYIISSQKRVLDFLRVGCWSHRCALEKLPYFGKIWCVLYLDEFFRAPAWACWEQQIGANQTALRERHTSNTLRSSQVQPYISSQYTLSRNQKHLLSHQCIECHPSAISLAVEPLSSIERVWHGQPTALFCPVDCICLGNSSQRCYSRLVSAVR